ncbi:MAG: TerB N-terminal domain-containing protein [Oscillospiraceae bacterium]|nr:TerB N-terminal domain-containing protein [Oscillospiraceae bacterium]
MLADDLKNTTNNSDRFQTVEIEFGDESAPAPRKSAPIQNLYEPGGTPPKTQSGACHYNLDSGISVSCKIEQWGRGFALFGDFLQDAKKYYKKTCISANYAYFFSYRPMYRELSHEQLCWYLFWRSKVREGIYPKTGLSYIFLYLYEQINLSDVIGCGKVYENIVGIWKNYRGEFPRIDKYIAEWLIDFSFINNFRINLDDIGEILPDIIDIATIPEMYMRPDFFQNRDNANMILQNLSVYDYTKSKFYTEKNKEAFDLHIAGLLHEALSGPEFAALIKKEADEGVKLKTTRESYMGAVCVYGHKKRITVEYKNIYKNFYIRQCVTDTVRCAENALRDYLGIKSKLALPAYPDCLAEAVKRYKAAHLTAGQPKAKAKKAPETEEMPAPPEFKPDMRAAAEIEKESWDTTMTLVELQLRDNAARAEAEDFAEADDTKDDGEFIAIDTGNDEDIFDILEAMESPGGPKLTDMDKFAAGLSALEREALESLFEMDENNGDFDAVCGEFLAENGTMLESVIDAVNEKAMDFIGDIVFDTAERKIIEDYKGQMIVSIREVIKTEQKL